MTKNLNYETPPPHRIFVIARRQLEDNHILVKQAEAIYNMKNILIQKQMGGWVYIMCSLNYSTLYVGVTSNIASRVYDHKSKAISKSFTSRYNCIKLVYYKYFETILEAIAEEKRIKGGRRRKKEDLINSINPEWKDLYDDIKYL